jgi:hypothetical protein
MRTCNKRSDSSNTRLDALLRDESGVTALKVNGECGEGFADTFSYFGNTLQQGTSGWRTKHVTNTVIEHRVHSTDLTQGPCMWVDDGESCVT